jgi:protein MpaA
VVNLVERFRPAAIVSIHSIDRSRECNNYDGPGEELARAMGRINGYPVRGSIGYPTPGSLGTWAGIERGIPTVTLELPSHHSPKRCWQDNRDALLACSQFLSPEAQSACHVP